jgi:cruciform cutting endonuclease 1
MPLKSRPPTAKDIQALLVRIGSTSSGLKATLEDRFARDLQASGAASRYSGWRARQDEDWRKKLRIVSIDMGIKNLAFCDAEISRPSEKSLDTVMKVLRWEKIDLVKTTRTYRDHLPSPRDIRKDTADADEDVDPFSSSVLSATAYRLIRDTILAGEPDIILIEKQRWRSSSSSAIQQWTVRVNTLESMMWAVLETLRAERRIVLPRLRAYEAKRNYEVFGIDPKRVGHYWLGTEQKLLPAIDPGKKTKTTRKTAEKKAKIELLRSWLTSASPSTSSSGTAPKISFEFGANTASTRKALCSPTKPAKRIKKAKPITDDVEDDRSNDVNQDTIKKLDDVTDCFLQAAAWVSWEQNRMQLLELLKRTTGEAGRVEKLSEEVLRDMITEMKK